MMEYGDRIQNPPDSLGLLLATARQARNLEQEDVATRLGIDVSVVQALEENAFQRFGAPVFVRGYLCRYARLLGLAEQEILDRYKQLGLNEPPPLRVGQPINSQAKMGDTGVRWISYGLFLGMIAYLGWFGLEQVSNHFELPPATHLPERETEDDVRIALSRPMPSTTQQGDTVAPPSLAPNPPAATPPAGDSPVATVRPQQPMPSPVAKMDDEVAQQQSAPVAVEETESPVVADGKAKLVMEFADDCWVTVKDSDGQRLAYDLMMSNTVHTLVGSPPFSIVFGNAPAVSIKLNDQPIDKSIYVPVRGTVARFSLDVPNQDS